MNSRDSGFYTTKEIAVILDVSEDTVSRIVNRYRVPFRRPAGAHGRRYFAMADFWQAIPLQQPGGSSAPDSQP